jgi:hypothetical protein
MDSCEVGDALTKLRRDLAWSDHELGDYFHAAHDKQAVRDEVFKLLANYKFEVQSTLFEKCKAQPQVRKSRTRFYQHAWYYHFKYTAQKTIRNATELMVVTASFGVKKERATFNSAVLDVLRQTLSKVKYAANFCPASADPCISVVDYCAWAIQRKWESPNQRDTRSYDLIRERITHEVDSWSHGKTEYY